MNFLSLEQLADPSDGRAFSTVKLLEVHGRLRLGMAYRSRERRHLSVVHAFFPVGKSLRSLSLSTLDEISVDFAGIKACSKLQHLRIRFFERVKTAYGRPTLFEVNAHTKYLP